MSKVLATIPTVRSHCVGATSWFAIFAGLGAASVGLNWTVGYLIH
jgi:hypothetical protein